MRTIFIFILLCLVQMSFAQSDIDVVLMKSGERMECTIQSIQSDTLVITRFSGKSQVTDSLAISEIAAYIVNNHYTTPAEDLIKATGHFYTGTAIMVGGGIIAVMAMNGGNKNLAVAGTAIGIFGSVFLFSGFSKMHDAAKKMNKIQLQNDRIIYKL